MKASLIVGLTGLMLCQPTMATPSATESSSTDFSLSRGSLRGPSLRHSSLDDTGDADPSEQSNVTVPTYQFQMPVDHFDLSNKDVYNNRYFVNDTYYKQGGPVVFFDYGEAGFDPFAVADALAEFSGPSLPMQLAAKLGALVIGWEHRYYGFSNPVELNETSGFPVKGVGAYKYLSVEQALEDVAVFANGFNKTRLTNNSVVQSPDSLGPYHTPWIFIGSSYAGSRAAWMRLKHPEIIYASWASSAPLQYQFDGSLYYNPLMRSIPQNCTNDIKAAIKFVDEAFVSGSPEIVDSIKTTVNYWLLNHTGAHQTHRAPSDLTSLDVGASLASSITLLGNFQNVGPTHSTQVLCDFMEAFDANGYSKVLANTSSILEQARLLLENPDSETPSKTGIAANHGNDGGRYAFYALIYGTVRAKGKLIRFLEERASVDRYPAWEGPMEDTSYADSMSWSWQTITETGVFRGSNPNNITVVSKWENLTAAYEIQYKKETFKGFDESSLPKFNNSGLLALGGWDLTLSNTMFSNGEFDPWRAFSIASQEEGAPNRNIVQTIPKCNRIPAKNDVFGITYLGAVHGDDIRDDRFSTGYYTDIKGPQEQGLDLFLSAWDAWAPCFNQSRDDIRNGRGVDGDGHAASGNKTSGGDNKGSKNDGSRPVLHFLSLMAPLATSLALF